MKQVCSKSRWIRLTLGITLIVGLIYLYVTRIEGNSAPSENVVIEKVEAIQEVTPPKDYPEPANKAKEVRSATGRNEKNATIVVKETGDPDVDRTVHLILSGGPFPYPKKDGSVFRNYEKRLPQKPRGFYHEYTVPTPGSKNRGARRIVTGGVPPTVFYYTTDHYNTFKKLEVVQ